jgi:peptide/nickel transport system permease protein
VRRYVFARLLQAIPLLLGIVTITFFIMRLAPGDPLAAMQERLAIHNVDPATIEAMRDNYGLNDPLGVQYLNWLGDLARGDLGTSIRYGRPVSALIAEALPFTLQLTVLALFFDALIGIPLGVMSAVRRGSGLDRGVTLAALVVYAVPGFWLGLMLILVFSVGLGWLPTSQAMSFDYEQMSFFARLGDRLWHLVLPVFVLGVASAAGTARYVRNRLLDTLGEDFILAGRARGLSERTVIYGHALKNALLPLITIYGMSLPFLIGGAAIIETLFAWPGMGRLAVEAVTGQDYPVIMAVTMIAAGLTVIGNLLADIAYGIVDPRVHYD